MPPDERLSALVDEYHERLIEAGKQEFNDPLLAAEAAQRAVVLALALVDKWFIEPLDGLLWDCLSEACAEIARELRRESR